MNMRLGITPSLLTAMAVLAAACAPAAPPPAPTSAPAAKPAAAAPSEAAKPAAQAATGGQLKLPAIFGMTGPVAAWNAPVKNALGMLTEDINKSGGFAGKSLVLEFLDPGSDPAQAANLVRSVADWAPVIIGPGTTLNAQGAIPVANQLGIPQVAISSVPELISKNRPNAFGLLAPPKELAIQGVGKWTQKEGLKKIVLIRDTKDPASAIQAEGVVEGLKKANVELAETITFTAGDVDFSAQVTKAKGHNPDGIAISGLPTETGGIIREIRRQNMTASIYSTQAGWNPETAKVAGSAIDGAYAMVEWVASLPRTEKLAAAYQERFKEQLNSGSALFYDAISIIREVYTKQGLTGDPAKLQDERAKLRDGLSKVKDYNGVAAVWTWTEDGLPSRPGVLVQHKGGQEMIIQ